MSTTPERADEQLSRLMVQLEELEGQFGEHEQFLGDILGKREELLETFETHRQALLDERQRKAQSVLDAANRIFDGLGRRTERFTTPDELNAFFAGDALVMKLRELAERLRALKDSVKADDIESRIKAARDQAVRGLRDRSDLFEDGGNVIKLGPRHRFSVNTQPLDLTLLPRGDDMAVHLTGTDYMAPLHDPELTALRAFWQVTLESESPNLYRGEYLAGQLLDAALNGRDGLDIETLERLVGDSDALATRVREFASARYRDGYEKGIHDHDATLILRAVVPLYRPAGPLVHAADARALAVAFWRHAQATPEAGWLERIRNAKAVRSHLQDATATSALATELAEAIAQFRVQQTLPLAEGLQAEAAAFLIAAITADSDQLPFTRYAASLLDALHAQLAASGSKALFNQALERLQDRPGAQWSLLLQWLQALAARPEHAALAAYAHEAAALHLHGPQLPHRIVDVRLMAEATSLLGQHPCIDDGTLRLAIDDLQSRLREHQATFLPAFRRYQEVRARIVQREREAMRLSEFKARPLTSFVRNKLINDVYLRVIGDNLAKQMGTVGEDKRSDLMGLLMLISPPGYGKTTLMEYVAHRLGLVFMKINGPSLGHQVRSLDPAQAPDATSRQELEKLNLALEMGNNVMLYVDDIQHTHPEFLQKFISLCDGTRRIEGVWRGRTRTYDLRGRKFAVVMAGNPYTESGEAFKIPDMLANRADIYNLGDVLGGMEDTFLLSYIENSLTSNAVLAPLATRDLADLYLLVDKARGREVSTNALTHAYSGAEINEIVGVLQRMLQVREVVFKVNQQYIASAAQADKYRVEPPFKLQGSYRNMNKLAEKISPVMNDAELRQVIADHYLGESQLLTQGAEENLLKLGELLGRMTPEQQSRWAQIKADFLRNKAMGADDADVGGRMVAQLADIAGGLQGLRDEPPPPAPQPPPWSDLLDALARIATPPASPTAASAPEQPVGDLLRSAHQPLLEGLERTLARQDHLHSALLELVEALKAGGITHASQREPAERVIPRIRTPEERAFEKTISALKFKAAEDAKKADAAKPPGEPGAS
jgi:hypothetical protein